MIRHVFSALCTKATVDRESNNVSIVDIVERLEIHVPAGTQLPFGFPYRADFVTLWSRQDWNQPAEAEMRTRVLSPLGVPLAEFLMAVDLVAAPRARAIGRFEGFRVAGTGMHEIEVSYRERGQDAWNVVHTYPVEVEVAFDGATPAQAGAPLR